MVRRLCIMADMPQPKIALMDMKLTFDGFLIVLMHIILSAMICLGIRAQGLYSTYIVLR
jgi:hypothetical protein